MNENGKDKGLTLAETVCLLVISAGLFVWIGIEAKAILTKLATFPPGVANETVGQVPPRLPTVAIMHKPDLAPAVRFYIRRLSRLLAFLRAEESSGGRDTDHQTGERGSYGIKKEFWQDGCKGLGVEWLYEDCAEDDELCRWVIIGYWLKHCPTALVQENRRRLAVVFRAGPDGAVDPDYLVRMENYTKAQR